MVSQLKNLYSSRTLWNLTAFLMWWYLVEIPCLQIKCIWCLLFYVYYLTMWNKTILGSIARNSLLFENIHIFTFVILGPTMEYNFLDHAPALMNETILYRFIKLYIGQWTFWKIHSFFCIWWIILWVCIYDEKYSKTNVFYDVVSQLKNLYSSRTLWNLAAFFNVVILSRGTMFTD